MGVQRQSQRFGVEQVRLESCSVHHNPTFGVKATASPTPGSPPTEPRPWYTACGDVEVAYNGTDLVLA